MPNTKRRRHAVRVATAVISSLTCGLAIGHPGLAGHDDLYAAALGYQPAAGPTAALSPQVPRSNAVLELSSDKVDFGSVFDTLPVATTTLTVRNTGTEPLRISDVKASCGCTEPKMSMMEIPPGGTGELEIGFKPFGRRGPQHKTIRITSNSRDKAVHEIVLNAFVRPVVWTVPATISGGSVVVGESSTSTLKIRSLIKGFETGRATVERFEYFRIRSGETSIITVVVDAATGAEVPIFTRPVDAPASDNVALDQDKARELDPAVPAGFKVDLTQLPPVVPLGESMVTAPGPGVPFEVIESTYTIEFRARGTPSRINEVIRVTTNQEDANSQVRVPFLASIVSRISAVPQVVALGVVEPDASIDRTFRLTSRSNQAFEVLGFDAGTAEHGLEASWTPVGSPATEYEVRVTGKVAEGSARVQTRMVFKVKVAGSEPETVEVPLNGVVRRVPVAETPAGG